MMTSKNTPNQQTPGFVSGHLAWLLGGDKSWWRVCLINSISDDDAKIAVIGGGGKLRLGNPFLLISSSGAAHHRCGLREFNGNSMSVAFV
jgi:hypothetical protein